MAQAMYSSLPLDAAKAEIRILVLHRILPSLVAVDVSCTLQVVSLDSPDLPPFIALSYTWDHPLRQHNTTGPAATDSPEALLPLPPKNIKINGNDITVTGNLEAALRTLASTSKEDVTLWVDAVCLNQQDNEEKSLHIGDMRRIYAESRDVLVWLGPEAQDSTQIMDLLANVGPRAVRAGVLKLEAKDLTTLMTRNDVEHPEHVALVDLHRKVAAEIRVDFPIISFSALLSRFWWYRTWVLQELLLAREITFRVGTSTVSFDDFTAGVLFLTVYLTTIFTHITPQHIMADMSLYAKIRFILENKPDTRATHMLGDRRAYTSGKDTATDNLLIRLLVRAHTSSSSFNSLGATNPRDKIYGLLGLASDAASLNLKVDYAAPVEIVYIDTALKLLQHGHTDILTLSQRENKSLRLPSWVPDFSSLIREPRGETSVDGFFNACGVHRYFKPTFYRTIPNPHQGPIRPPLGSSSNATQLHVLGIPAYRIGTIAKRGTSWKPPMKDWAAYTSSDIPTIMYIELESLALQSSRYESIDAREDALWRTLVFDQERSGSLRQRANRDKQNSASYDGYLTLRERAAWMARKGPSDVDVPADQLPPPLPSAYQISLADIHHTVPFLSSDGHIGLAPAGAEVGDVIVVIPGCGVLHTLAKKNGVRLFDEEGATSDGAKAGKEMWELVGETYVHGLMDGEAVRDEMEWETFAVC